MALKMRFDLKRIQYEAGRQWTILDMCVFTHIK